MKPSSKPVRIGNAQAFWGDRTSAAAEMLAREPDLDYLTLDYLAEVSMSILAMQRQRDPQAGFAREFVEVVRSLAPYWCSGGRCRRNYQRRRVESSRLRRGLPCRARRRGLPRIENRRRQRRRRVAHCAKCGNGRIRLRRFEISIPTRQSARSAIA